MAIPLIAYLLGGAAAVAVLGAEGESTSVWSGDFSGLGFKSVAKGAAAPVKLTGPLPPGAMAAWNATKHGKRSKRSSYGPDNDIHKKGSWLRFATYSENWDKKHEKMRFYAKPPGVLFIKSTDKVFNLAWMMRCKPNMYPGYGRAARRNCRLNQLDPWLGPKADWNTVKGLVKDSMDAIPELVKGAGVIVAGVTSGGQSLKTDPAGQVDQIISGIKSGLEPIGDTGGNVKKRLASGRVVVDVIGNAYVQQLLDGNPWILRNGKFDIGKNYMPDPKTYEDLYRPGNARPLLWNP